VHGPGAFALAKSAFYSHWDTGHWGQIRHSRYQGQDNSVSFILSGFKRDPIPMQPSVLLIDGSPQTQPTLTATPAGRVSFTHSATSEALLSFLNMMFCNKPSSHPTLIIVLLFASTATKASANCRHMHLIIHVPYLHA